MLFVVSLSVFQSLSRPKLHLSKKCQNLKFQYFAVEFCPTSAHSAVALSNVLFLSECPKRVRLKDASLLDLCTWKLNTYAGGCT